MGIGGVVYEVDELGNRDKIYDFSETFKASEFPDGTTNNIAEVLALEKILSFFVIENATHHHIEIFGDSRIVINRLNDGSGGRGLFQPYIKRANKTLRDFPNTTIKWIAREKNNEADAISR